MQMNIDKAELPPGGNPIKRNLVLKKAKFVLDFLTVHNFISVV